MRREFLFATIVAAALSVGVSAQSGTGQAGQAGQGGTMGQSGSYGPEKDAKNKSQNVTLTGCVQSASQPGSATAGTSGTAGGYGSTGSTSSSDTMGTAQSRSSASRSTSDQFVLTNVTGDTGGASISSSDKVMLSGKEKDLQKYVGQKVEIRGKLETSSSSKMGAPSGTAGTAGTSGSTAGNNMWSGGKVKVNSVKAVSGSCS